MSPHLSPSPSPPRALAAGTWHGAEGQRARRGGQDAGRTPRQAASCSPGEGARRLQSTGAMHSTSQLPSRIVCLLSRGTRSCKKKVLSLPQLWICPPSPSLARRSLSPFFESQIFFFQESGGGGGRPKSPLFSSQAFGCRGRALPWRRGSARGRAAARGSTWGGGRFSSGQVQVPPGGRPPPAQPPCGWEGARAGSEGRASGLAAAPVPDWRERKSLIEPGARAMG